MPAAASACVAPTRSRRAASCSSVTHPLYRSCTVITGTPTILWILSNWSNFFRHALGKSRLAPGTSSAATYASAVTTLLPVSLPMSNGFL